MGYLEWAFRKAAEVLLDERVEGARRTIVAKDGRRTAAAEARRGSAAVFAELREPLAVVSDVGGSGYASEIPCWVENVSPTGELSWVQGTQAQCPVGPQGEFLQ